MIRIATYNAFQRDEIHALYASVGWTAYTDDLERLERAFAKSLLVLAAYDEGNLLGLLRLVGDGEAIVFLQDVLVRPACQRQGIGRALIEEALRRYPDIRQVQLTTDRSEKTQAFYETLGFCRHEDMGLVSYMLRR